MRRASVASLMIAALAVACQDRNAAQPQPAPTAAPGRLKPLTSRDATPPLAPGEPATMTPPLPPGHPPIRNEKPAAGGAVSGSVVLGPKLRARQAPTDALFIIARSAATRQVLAVRKAETVSFPFAFEISAADAMVEGTPFVGPFDITARLSKTGDAMPSRGDIEGTSQGIAAGAREVVITLDTVRQ